MSNALPIHPTMRHPLTGQPIQAVWVNPAGRAFWPVIGASEDGAGATGATGPTGAGAGATGATGQAAAGATGATASTEADKPLGENGERALKAERDARKALETQLTDLKKGLASALGVKDDGDKPSDGDTLVAVQQQIADMKHENAVLLLAGAHKITDKDDLDLLRTTREPEALAKLAARLGATSPATDDGKPRRPRADLSQGSGSGGDSKASVSGGRELFAARRGKKSA